MNWFLFWLFLHIVAAVIAFGPIFVFPIVGAMAQRKPQHFVFAIELNHTIELRLVIPLALSMLVSGVGLIFAAHVNLLASTYLWVSILLYLLAIAIALGIALPTTAKLVNIGHMAEAAPPRPGPPPPQVMALINRVRGAGMVLTLLFLIIIFLMIIKPGGLVGGNIFG
jgi:uncharacterized membrane protein